MDTEKLKLKPKTWVLFFIILLLSNILAFNFLYITFIEQEKMLYKKQAEIDSFFVENSSKYVQYAVIGDSHAENGFNPNYVPNSFNFATSGENYLKSYYKVKHLVEVKNITISTLILEIDMHTFTDKNSNVNDSLKNVYFYSRLFNETIVYDNSGLNYLQFMIKNNFPFMSRGKQTLISLKNILFQSQKLEKGHVMKFSNLNDLNASSHAKLKFDNYHFGEDYTLIDENTYEYFDKLLQYAIKHDIEIIFIKYPLSSAYDEQLRQNNINREQYYIDLFEKINITTTDYKILDYYSIFFENDSYFADSDHLNYKGAKIFSTIVSRDLEKVDKNKN